MYQWQWDNAMLRCTGAIWPWPSSGTVTLDIMRHGRAMVGLFRTGPVGWLGGKILLTTPDRLLPNLIAGKRIVPEFVPHWGRSAPIESAVAWICWDSDDARRRQREAIERAIEPYEGSGLRHECVATAVMEVAAG